MRTARRHPEPGRASHWSGAGDDDASYSAGDTETSCANREQNTRGAASIRLHALVVASVLFGALAVSGLAAARAPRSQPASATPAGLTVNVAGEGLVTYSDGSPPCAASGCVSDESPNEVVFLTAAPARGYAFKGWTEGCVGSGPICGVTPAQVPIVSAVFAHAGDFELTVAGPGTVHGGSVSCGAGDDQCSTTLSGNGTTALTPVPATGAGFVGWGGACAQFATQPCTIDNSSVDGATATFAAMPLPSTPQPIQVADNTGVISAGVVGDPGSLDSCLALPTCQTSLPAGSAVDLTAGGSFVNGPFTPPPSVSWAGSCVGSWPVCALLVDGPIDTKVTTPIPVGLSRPVARSSRGPVAVQITVTVEGRGRLRAVRGRLTPRGCGSRAIPGGYSCVLSEARNGFELRARPVADRFRSWGSSFGTYCKPARSAKCANRITYDGPALAAVFSH